MDELLKALSAPLNHRRIALAVILQALKDLTNPTAGNHPSRRSSLHKNLADAKEFCCSDNEDLKFWCAVAGVGPRAVGQTAIKVLEGKVTRDDLDKGYRERSYKETEIDGTEH